MLKFLDVDHELHLQNLSNCRTTSNEESTSLKWITNTPVRYALNVDIKRVVTMKRGGSFFNGDCNDVVPMDCRERKLPSTAARKSEVKPPLYPPKGGIVGSQKSYFLKVSSFSNGNLTYAVVY